MRATINRITAVFYLIAFFQFHLFAQILDTGIPAPKATPQAHKKVAAAIPTSGLTAVAESAGGLPTTYPVCAFDELNDIRCQEDPVFKKELAKYLEEVVPALAAGIGEAKTVPGPLLTVSVVVHIIHNGEPVGQGANLPQAQIEAQIAILNQDFSSLNPQFNQTPQQWKGIAGTPNIQFCLASVDPSGNPTNGITRHNMQVTGSSWNNNNINSTIKPATKWDPTRYFNVYVLAIPGTTAAGGVVGFSNYPTPGLIGSDQDGVVIDYRWFGAPGFPTSGWRPLTHETGHYLGLPHTFQGNSCSQDDGISDTPNIEKSTREFVTLDCSSGYPTGPVSCGNEHLYVNYMDYVTENCYTSFTVQQVNVMRAVLNGTSQGFGYGSRNQLIQNAPLLCQIAANDAGIIGIVAPPQTTCTPDSLQPVVTLRNFGSADLTAVFVVTQVNGLATDTTLWSGSLFSGENIDLTLPPFQALNEGYSLSFYTLLPNGEPDEHVENDTISGGFYTYLAIAPPMSEDFEDETSLPTNTGIISFNVSGDSFEWELTNEASAWGQGSKSVVFDNFSGDFQENPFGTIDALITRSFNFSEINGATLTFDVAYAAYDDFLADTLMILVATNCTQNFNQLLYRKGGAQLASAPNTDTLFTPTPTQWRTDVVDLSAYDGIDDVTIAFVNVSSWGNRIFLDNIRVGVGCYALEYDWEIQPNSCGLPPGSPCNGSASILVSNHNGALSYQWEGLPPSNDQPSVDGLCPGEVTVTVTDAFGCTLTASATVGQTPTPVLDISATPETGSGAADGTATVTVSNGTAPYNYTWSNGVQQTDSNLNYSTISGLSPGLYSVTVEDDNGCAVTAEVQVGTSCNDFLAAITPNNISCFGGADGSALANPQNGTSPFTYEWSNGATTASINDLTAGAYTVTITDANGCTASQSVSLDQPAALELAISSTDETALNANDGTATATASGGTPGYSYLWSNGASTAAISELAPGTYSLTATDNAGCEATASVTIQPFACPGIAATISATNITCHGQNDGTAAVQVTGGVAPFAYLWSNGQSTQAVNNLSKGTISVTVTDDTGCATTLSATVDEPPALTLTISHTNETGPGAKDGTATALVSGGTPAPGGTYFYNWSNGATTPSIQNLAPGSYSVTVQDVSGCSTIGQVAVVEYGCAIQVELNSLSPTCPDMANGAAEVASISGGSGPFTYLWSNGQTSFQAINLVAGTYSVTVTDGTGCSVVESVTLESSDLISPVALSKNATIYLDENGMAVLDPALVDNGSYDNCSQINLEVVPASFSCAHVGANVVTLKVSDSSGNFSQVTAEVTVLDVLPPFITCPGDLSVQTCAVNYPEVTATDNCGTYTLSLVTGLMSGELFPTGSTQIVWKASDAQGNEASCSFQVTVESAITIDYDLSEPSCHGFSDGAILLSPSGGLPPYQTTWSNGADPSSLSAGEYTVTVTDAGQCSTTQTISLSQPEALAFQLFGGTPATGGQANGTINFGVTGGTPPYNVSWYANGNLLPNFDPLAVPPGIYQALVTDTNGCEINSVPITVENISAAEEANAGLPFKLYPNPTAGALWVEFDFPAPRPVSLALLDLTGRPVFSFDEKWLGKQGERLDLKNVAPGIYWLKILVGAEVVWRRVIVI